MQHIIMIVDKNISILCIINNTVIQIISMKEKKKHSILA